MKICRAFLHGTAGALAAIALAAPFDLDGCTGITLKARNGDIVYGRTLEWGSFDLGSRLVIFPRDYQYRAVLPAGMRGLDWTGRYGVAGIDALQSGYLLDGINEAGLAGGLFYHPGFAEYKPWSPELAGRALPPTQVLNYLLSSCANVAEVRQALDQITVVSVVEPALGIVAPVHLMVTEPGGKQIIIEWNDGKVKIYDSKVGVITNSPNYDWHLTNLRNYVELTDKPHQEIDLGKLRVSPLGGGSGMLGLPGDFTPPSRFIRATAFVATARPLPDGAEGIYEAFRILDNFDVPLGNAESDGHKPAAGMRSSTIWTIAHNLAGRRLFYHTQNDRQVQSVELKRIDFGALKEPVVMTLDNGSQAVKDRTPDLEK
ncbi:MAG: linear amide C-N hydrolase [Victivallaceae bacterium]